ncbi:MAG: hypothetical protein ACT4RN_20480 [Pseudonocardia sp.]
MTVALPAGNPYHRAGPPRDTALTVADRDERLAARVASGELAGAERARALRPASPEQLRRLAVWPRTAPTTIGGEPGWHRQAAAEGPGAGHA